MHIADAIKQNVYTPYFIRYLFDGRAICYVKPPNLNGWAVLRQVIQRLQIDIRCPHARTGIIESQSRRSSDTLSGSGDESGASCK